MKARAALSVVFGHSKLPVAATAIALALLALGVGVAAAVAPVVSVENATNVEYTTADVEGTVNPEGQGTSWRFQYATAADFSDAQEGPSGFTETSETVLGQLAGLQPDTTYHLRLVAENGDGQSEAVAASTFETKPVAKPSASEPLVSSITGKTAHFEGTVDSNAPADNSALSQAAKDAYATHWWFTCSPTCNFSGPSEGDLAADDDLATVDADVVGLGGNTDYTVTLHVRNAGGESTAENEFTSTAIKPDVGGSMFSALNPGDTFATIEGTVNPHNLVTDCRFVYGVGAASGNEVPCSPGNPDLDEEQTVRVTATAGQFRLTFESETTEDLPYNADVAAVQSALEDLSTIGAGNVSVLGVEVPATATFTSGYDITFQGSFSGKDVPSINAESGTVPLENGEDANGDPVPGSLQVITEADGSTIQSVRVQVELSGLAPETEYLYKIVATNAAGTSEGPEQAFTTLSPPEEEICPNEPLRIAQGVSGGECRAFEKVSPSDKNGANIAGEGPTVLPSTDGNAATFTSRGGFAGTVGAGATGISQYIARRGGGGWTTKAITPTPFGAALPPILGGNEHYFFSDDLETAIVKAYDLPSVHDDIPNAYNLYRQDTDTGALQTVTPGAQKAGPLRFESILRSTAYGASADTGVVAFADDTQLLPAATPGTKNAYEWDHGTLRLAGILPNGDVPSGGSIPLREYRATVSADGSRVLFLSPVEGNSQLYMRRDHADTVWVTESESTVPVPEPESVQVEWVSRDADKILFSTGSKLLDEDQHEGGKDLYLYTESVNPQAESNLELISVTGQFAVRVVGASDDASRVYYAGFNEVFLWEDSQTWVAFPFTASIAGEGIRDDVMASPGRFRVSSDGRYIAWRGAVGVQGSNIDLTGHDTRRLFQLYVYDAVNDTVTCASCVPSGVTRAEVPRESSMSAGVISKPIVQVRPRLMSADGRRVFLSTAAPLVSPDTNGVMDVYVLDTRTGHRQLVSTGKGDGRSEFAGASTTGADAFFLTYEKLLGTDQDKLVDLYDARVGGGFAEPPPPPTPCSGDNCRNPLSPPVNGQSPATSTFSGSGDKPRKIKRHKKHRKKHHKKRHKKHHKKQGAKGTSRSGGHR